MEIVPLDSGGNDSNSYAFNQRRLESFLFNTYMNKQHSDVLSCEAVIL
jgi:hypothetical protein